MARQEVTRDEARDRVGALVERYAGQSADGVARRYNEARTVNDLILPLFEALGWDIHNRTVRDEVLPEEPAASGRADWAFRIGSVTRLLVEAKSLGTGLANPQFARQAINYSYSRGVTWAVLTNFRELRLYNAEWALPDPDLSRFLTFQSEKFVDDFDRLWLLSKPAIEAGLLDAEAEKYGKKRTKTPVGEQLFSDLVVFRSDLRKVFTAYNPDIDPVVIDHAVQRLLDRLIFIRAAEDREIEPPHLRPLLRTLEHTRKRGTLWDQLRAIFRDWERRYDSQLFADQPLDHLETEFKPIWDTVEGLHETAHGLVQYDFRGIDADVLGGVYEQYLGHLAKVDTRDTGARSRSKSSADITRPIRKARGVYYTPKWIVRYIVEASLGSLLKRLSPDEVRVLRIIDPACGSGSFLVEAFRVLTQYWTRLERPKTDDRALNLRLRILDDNLFGIDLDAQAVEIAQLNLLLAALNQPTLLPDLTANFRIANSLFDTASRQIPSEFDRGGWLTPVETRGPELSRKYDVVVMNPPYYDLQLHPYQQAVLRDVYPEVASGHDDVLYYFLARAADLIKPGGQLGCVVARYWLDSLYAEKLRGMLSTRMAVTEIVDFRSYQPFGRDVGVNAAIVIAEAGGPSSQTRFVTPATEGFGEIPQALMEGVSTLTVGPPAFVESNVQLSKAPWRHGPSHRASTAETVRLDDIAQLTQGVKAGRNEIFVVSAAFAKARHLEEVVLRPVLEGEDIGAFVVRNTGRQLLYLDGSRDLSEYPNIAQYLNEHREELFSRAEVSRGSYPWWRLQRPRRSPVMDATVRLIAPQLATGPRFSAIASSEELAGALGLTDTLMLSVLDESFSPYFLLGAINSAYGVRWAREHAKMKRGGYHEFFATTMSSFPVPVVDRETQDLVAEYARELQTVLPPATTRLLKGRFDDALNQREPRVSLIHEIDQLVGRADD
ncbi:MAG: N-6 DNA methylase [Chloroflexi bacterium]|nr:N-6 DNA methylase [Chloroflexota bacterium]